jgi:hypothetical protein
VVLLSVVVIVVVGTRQEPVQPVGHQMNGLACGSVD